jgi:hypothetical protein
MSCAEWPTLVPGMDTTCPVRCSQRWSTASNAPPTGFGDQRLPDDGDPDLIDRLLALLVGGLRS